MRKITIIGMICLSFVLAACNQTEPLKLTVEKFRVVEIPEQLYEQCPDIRKEKMPYYKSLTDRQLANFIVKLYSNNVKCRNAIDNIKNYINIVKTELDNKPIY